MDPLIQRTPGRGMEALARALPKGVSVGDVADSCRYGAISFLNGVLAAWGKPELGAWLAGPYRDVTRHAREALDLAARRDAIMARRSAVARRTIAPYAIERVMREAHDEVLITLRTLVQPDGGVGFAFSALGGALVSRCRDDQGEPGWIPVSPTRMRLAERVLSLIAVDYLTRPDDYESSLAVCSTCRVVAFDATARARGLCRVHAGSGIRFNGRASEPPAGVAQD